MKLLILFTCLSGLLQAKVVHRHLDVLEGEATYRQTVTIDYDKNIQIVEVPAHNQVVHSKTIFDFNKGKLVESHPETKTCYVSDILEETADLKTFDDYLQKKTDGLTASKERAILKAFKISRKMNLNMIPTLAYEIMEECSQSQIYETVEIPMDTPVKTTREDDMFEEIQKMKERIEFLEEVISKDINDTLHYFNERLNHNTKNIVTNGINTRSNENAIENTKAELSKEVAERKEGNNVVNTELEEVKGRLDSTENEITNIKTDMGDLPGKWSGGSYCILANGPCPNGFSRYSGHLWALDMYSERPPYIQAVNFGDSYLRHEHNAHSNIGITACCK